MARYQPWLWNNVAAVRGSLHGKSPFRVKRLNLLLNGKSAELMSSWKLNPIKGYEIIVYGLWHVQFIFVIASALPWNEIY